MEEYTNYLAHHGVKGMKWGVRRRLRESSPGRYVSSHKKQIRNGVRVGARVGLGVYAGKKVLNAGRIVAKTHAINKGVRYAFDSKNSSAITKGSTIAAGGLIAINLGKAAVALAISKKLKNKSTSSVSSTTKNSGKEKVLKVVQSPTYKKAATAYGNSKVGNKVGKTGVAISKKAQAVVKGAYEGTRLAAKDRKKAEYNRQKRQELDDANMADSLYRMGKIDKYERDKYTNKRVKYLYG